MTLPFITAELPGFGGTLKAKPGHFVVEELPLYEASGAGSHLYVSLTREDMTTRYLAQSLARLFDLPVKQIGYAGLKDRRARCTQVFSLPDLQPEAAQRIPDHVPVTLNWARLHRNKLKVGHLLGNRFQITVTDLAVSPAEALQRGQAVVDALRRSGAPNFFGPQRFGIDGGNVERGREALLGRGPRDRWLNKLLISAYQSHLFNIYLTRRMERGLFGQLLAGDVAKKADTGGMFDVEDPEAEQPRYERGDIHFTGPMYGRKMWAARAEAGELEAEILDGAGLTAVDFAKARTQGARRPARLWLADMALSAGDESLQVDFSLPKGAYATIVLRELTKAETNLPADIVEESR